MDENIHFIIMHIGWEYDRHWKERIRPIKHWITLNSRRMMTIRVDGLSGSSYDPASLSLELAARILV